MTIRIAGSRRAGKTSGCAVLGLIFGCVILVSVIGTFLGEPSSDPKPSAEVSRPSQAPIEVTAPPPEPPRKLTPEEMVPAVSIAEFVEPSLEEAIADRANWPQVIRLTSELVFPIKDGSTVVGEQRYPVGTPLSLIDVKSNDVLVANSTLGSHEVLVGNTNFLDRVRELARSSHNAKINTAERERQAKIEAIREEQRTADEQAERRAKLEADLAQKKVRLVQAAGEEPRFPPLAGTKRALRDQLRDPESLVLEAGDFIGPNYSELSDGPAYYWLAKFRAKNGFGGYNAGMASVWSRHNAVVKVEIIE